MIELRYIQALVGLLTPSERRRMPLLVGWLVLSGFLEVLGLSTVFLFIGILNELSSNAPLQFRIGFIDPDFSTWSVERFAAIGGIALVLVFAIKAFCMLAIQKYVMSFIFGAYERFSVKLLSGYMDAPLSFYLENSSAEVQRNVNVQPAAIFNSAAASLAYIASNAIAIACIFTVLCFIDPLTSTLAVGLLAIVGMVYNLLVRRRLSELGRQRHTHIAAAIKWVAHSISGIREIRIAGTELFFKGRFQEQVHAVAMADRSLRIVSLVPSLINEGALVIGMIGMTLLYLSSGHTLQELLPTLAAFGLAGLRVLGMAGSMATHVQHLQFHGPAVVAIGDLVRDFERWSIKSEDRHLTFDRSVMMSEVSFRYPRSRALILSDVTFSIPKGNRVALLGASGCGKTTLLSILLGLLRPSSGSVLVDGTPIDAGLRAWFDKVAYVPQSIFILDDTVRANLVLGCEANYTEERIWSALQVAQLADVVRGLPDGLDSKLGENGARLSGGERQRIGIARALLRDPELLALDEATSALDRTTEKAVMEAIIKHNPNMTLVTATHRIDAIQEFDAFYALANGKVRAASTVKELPLGGVPAKPQ